jgi:hypothetical protein
MALYPVREQLASNSDGLTVRPSFAGDVWTSSRSGRIREPRLSCCLHVLNDWMNVIDGTVALMFDWDGSAEHDPNLSVAVADTKFGTCVCRHIEQSRRIQVQERPARRSLVTATRPPQ